MLLLAWSLFVAPYFPLPLPAEVSPVSQRNLAITVVVEMSHAARRSQESRREFQDIGLARSTGKMRGTLFPPVGRVVVVPQSCTVMK